MILRINRPSTSASTHKKYDDFLKVSTMKMWNYAPLLPNSSSICYLTIPESSKCSHSCTAMTICPIIASTSSVAWSLICSVDAVLSAEIVGALGRLKYNPQSIAWAIDLKTYKSTSFLKDEQLTLDPKHSIIGIFLRPQEENDRQRRNTEKSRYKISKR